MTGKSSIEWTEQTWNPIVGCSIVSPGCTNCYAMGMAYRFKESYLGRKWAGAAAENVARSVNGRAVWTGQLLLAPDHILEAPLRRRKPTTYFVNSMGDLFHEDCPDEWIDRVFDIMESGPAEWSPKGFVKSEWHTFQILTKRAERMRRYMTDRYAKKQEYADKFKLCPTPEMRNSPAAVDALAKAKPSYWKNIWLGVSTERQQEADERIPHLLQTLAAVRFISAEPLLGPIDLTTLSVGDDLKWNALGGPGRTGGLDWVIAGGESGPGARPMHPQWVRDIRDQCTAAGVEFFFKQYGSWAPCDAINVSLDHALCGLMACAPHIERDWTKALDFFQKTKGVVGADVLAYVGKKAGGRLLDGIEHNGFPNAPVSA